MKTGIRWSQAAALATVLLAAQMAAAGPVSKGVQETVEIIARKFGAEAAEIGTETLASRLEALTLKYGDEVLLAAREGGPKAVTALEKAGSQAPELAKLLAKEGDKALWIADDAARASLFARYGDDAAEAMLKHKSLAEPLIAEFGTPAAKAMESLSSRSARQLSIMATDGELAAIGRTPALLDVVSKFGDKAMDFIWKNKKGLTVAAALGAFLSNPQPFLDGTRDLAEIVSREVVAPVASTVAGEAARRADWTWVFVAAILALTVYLSIRYYLRWQFARR